MTWVGWVVAFAVPAMLAGLSVWFIHRLYRAPRVVETKSPADLGLDCREVSIPTERGRRLFGWLIARDRPAPLVVIVHGWGGNAGHMLPLAPLFHDAGLHVLLIDARNHGRSDADSFSSMPRFAEDVGHAVDWAARELGERCGKRVLLGHSVGGGAVLLAASRRTDIAAVISIASFAHPASMMRRQLRAHGVPALLAGAILRYIEWVIGYRYDDIAPVHTVCRTGCPVLLVHGTHDTTVPAADARTIHAACPDKDVELLLIEGATHTSVARLDSQARKLLAFLARAGVIGRLPEPADTAPQ